MGTFVGAPLLVTLLTGAVLVTACGHITKYKIEEVPISSFSATAPAGPVAATDPSASVAVPPIIDMGPGGAATPPAGSGATASAPAAAAGAPPQAIAGGDDVPGDQSDPKIAAATKLLKSGKRTDLAAARKLLSATVFAGTGTPDQARLLRLVCSKLGDKACVVRCTSFIR
jgi:hypothetical protein